MYSLAPARVYVIQGSDKARVKIGRSRNPEQRAKGLRADHGATSVLFQTEARDDAVFIEKEAQKRLAAQAVGEEWFAVSLDEARSAISAATEWSERIKVAIQEEFERSSGASLKSIIMKHRWFGGRWPYGYKRKRPQKG